MPQGPGHTQINYITVSEGGAQTPFFSFKPPTYTTRDENQWCRELDFTDIIPNCSAPSVQKTMSI